jgi:hypothetical protein
VLGKPQNKKGECSVHWFVTASTHELLEDVDQLSLTREARRRVKQPHGCLDKEREHMEGGASHYKDLWRIIL